MTVYCEIRRDRFCAIVAEAWRDAISDGLRGTDSCDIAGGRGGVRRFVYPGGIGVVRRYRRGGAMRFVAQDSYFRDNRAAREFDLTRALFDEGLSVPMPLGACWERRGPWYRGAIATRFVEGATLLDVARSAPADAPEAMRRAGVLVRRMHDLRVYHADLHVGNFLVDDGSVFLLDFDNARRFVSLPPSLRVRNLLRFRRSIEKHGLPPELFHALCKGYGDVEMPFWLDGIYRVKGRFSDWLSGRRGIDDARRDSD